MTRAPVALALAASLFVPLASGPVRDRAPEPPAKVESHRFQVKIEITQAPDPAPVSRFDLAKELFALTNVARADRGLAPLGWWTAAVNPAAKAQTDRMVEAGKLFHNRGLDSLLYSLKVRTIAENVGMGPSIAALHRAFMRSKDHRVNVLDEEFNLAAVWVVRDVDGLLFATVVFGRPA